jgi:hypothetical protein
VRSETLLVAGGFWGLADGDSAKLARALGMPRYSLLRSGDGVVVASNTTADAQGKLAAAGCVFPVMITQVGLSVCLLSRVRWCVCVCSPDPITPTTHTAGLGDGRVRPGLQQHPAGRVEHRVPAHLFAEGES